MFTVGEAYAKIDYCYGEGGNGKSNIQPVCPYHGRLCGRVIR